MKIEGAECVWGDCQTLLGRLQTASSIILGADSRGNRAPAIPNWVLLPPARLPACRAPATPGQHGGENDPVTDTSHKGPTSITDVTDPTNDTLCMAEAQCAMSRVILAQNGGDLAQSARQNARRGFGLLAQFGQFRMDRQPLGDNQWQVACSRKCLLV